MVTEETLFGSSEGFCLLQLLATIVNPDPRNKMATVTMAETEGSHLLRPIKNITGNSNPKDLYLPHPFSLSPVRCDKTYMPQERKWHCSAAAGWMIVGW